VATRSQAKSGEFGPDGDRTHDLHVANVALSQLSYRPSLKRRQR
jgi:hypothetical protein